MSRLITTVAGDVSRVYSYSQDGDLLAALVDGLLTTFVYDGHGSRLQTAVDGEVVTYTLDYAGGFRILFEEGGEFSDTKHYLYGLACLGEQVDADEPETEEWRYYQRDGKNLVRQTSNRDREVTFAWTYSPTGGVQLGEKGPVTYLDCGDNAIYDWSTGLIFKRNRYFDPANSLWITLGGIVIWQTTHPPANRHRRRGKGNRKRLIFWCLALLLLALVLAGCDAPTPGTPTSTPCPTPPTATPGTPTVPPTLPPTSPPTNTPPPTSPPPAVTPQPPPADTPTVPPPSPPTPEPPTSTPYPYTVPPNLSPPTVSVFGTVKAIRGKEGYWYTPPSHRGIDVIPDGIGPDGIRFYENNNAVIGWPVFALYAGYLFFDATDMNRAYLSIGADINTFRDVDYQLMYSHINRTRGEGNINPGNQIGTVMDITFDPNYRQGIFHHLHLEIRETANKLNTFDPEFLIHPVSG